MKQVSVLDGSRESIAILREKIRVIEQARSLTQRDVFPRDVSVTSGCQALDQLLPAGGFSRGSLIEWLAGGSGSGVGTLALVAAREAAWEGGAVVVMDRQRHFYPPAAAALGIDLENMVVVRAGNLQDELWALDQCLRCPGVAAVWGEFAQLGWRAFRRLQLAAEESGALGLLLRPAQVRGQPTWSQIQLLVEPLVTAGPRRWRLEITRCQAATSGGVAELELDEVTGILTGAVVTNPMMSSATSADGGAASRDDRINESHPLHLAAQLAHPTPRRRSVGT